MDTVRFKRSYVPQSGSHHRQTRTKYKTAGGEGIRSSSAGLGSRPRVRMRRGAEPCRNVTFESMLFSSHLRCSMSRGLMRLKGSSLEGLALFPERGCSNPGIRHAYFRLEQRHEEQQMLAHAIAETDATSAAESDLSPFRNAI